MALKLDPSPQLARREKERQLRKSHKRWLLHRNRIVSVVLHSSIVTPIIKMEEVVAAVEVVDIEAEAEVRHEIEMI